MLWSGLCRMACLNIPLGGARQPLGRGRRRLRMQLMMRTWTAVLGALLLRWLPRYLRWYGLALRKGLLRGRPGAVRATL